LGRTLKTTLGYTLKLILFSGIALIPVLFLSPHLAALFTGQGRLIAHGAPLFINALVYAGTGIFLLAVTKDKQFLSMKGMLRKREKRS
jgi:putative peptidoglycan lipid II flippase